MTERPETRFIWNGDVSLAYQVMGTGPPALLYLQGWVSNIELNWDAPVMARFLRGLARNRLLVMHDVRGMGVSERASPDDVWPLETVMEDLVVLLDEIGVDRISILATNEDAFVACMFAATYPERTDGLILYEASTNFLWSPETPWEWTEERFAEQEAGIRQLRWARASAASNVKEDQPSMAGDAAYAEWWYRYALLSQGEGHAIASTRKYMHTDLRAIVPSIHVPVLILVRPDHPEASWMESGRHLAGLIRNGLLPSSGLAIADDRVIAAILVGTITDAPPPFGGPWIMEVFSTARGAGRALLGRALQRTEGSLGLAVTEGNPAIAVYESLGFRRTFTAYAVDL